MNKNQRGFSAVEIIIALFVIVLIGLVGWYVLDKNNTSTTATTSKTVLTTKKPAPATKKTTFLNGPKQGWKTYTNYKAGFSVEVPASFLSSYGAGCSKTSESYRPASGMVPTAIIEDGNNFSITEQYIYQLSGATQTSSGITNYSKCDKVVTTLETISKYNNHGAEDSPLLMVIPISIYTIKNDDEIAAKARDLFGDNKITVTGLSQNAGGWKDVGLDSTEPGTFGGSFQLRYYEKQKKLVYISQGQAGKLAYPSDDGFFDSEVINSFKLID